MIHVKIFNNNYFFTIKDKETSRFLDTNGSEHNIQSNILKDSNLINAPNNKINN